MKKFFSFIAMVAVVLGLASCDPNGNVINPDEDHLSNFSASIEYTAPQTAAITVTSADKNCYFFAFSDPAVMLPTWTKEKINEFLQNTMFDGETYPAGLSEDQRILSATNLQVNTKYVVIMFKVADGYAVDGEVEYKFFTTPESWR